MHMHPGSFIVRRSITSKGNYAITVCEGRKIKSYKVGGGSPSASQASSLI